MPASPELAEDLAQATVELYQSAELTLLERVADRLMRGLESPSWADQKLAEIEGLNREARAVLEALRTQGRPEVAEATAAAYQRGQMAGQVELRAADLPSGFLATNQATVGALAGEIVTGLESTHVRILRAVEDGYRQVVQMAVGMQITGAETRREAAQRALNDFAARGVSGFRDRTGRRWDLASYTEMAVRTGAGHAAVQGHLDKLADAGEDLVIVSGAAGACKLCRPWEGRVLSVKGRSPGYPTVDQARSSGLHHPGCRHSEGIYLPGVTPPVRNKGTEQQDRDRQKLRYLERQVRSAKREQAVARTPQAQREARAKVRAYQAKIRAHVSETGLLRQSHREQVGQAR